MSSNDFRDGQGTGEFRSGFVALVGRPNVGKSTLMNSLVGQTVSIATRRPQTTRTRIRGVVNIENAQIVFVDTPGMHEKEKALNRFMLEEARSAIGDVDLVVMLVEAHGKAKGDAVKDEDSWILEEIAKSAKPCVLAVNKIDRVKKKDELLPLLASYSQGGNFKEMVPISALKGDGLKELTRAIEKLLPQGPKYFPEDMVTDQPERLLVAELVREQAIVRVGQELPYSLAVETESFKDLPGKSPFVGISAVLYVERDSQKGILIGKKGKMLKEIGSASRRSIERMLNCRVHLDLRVKVARKWSQTMGGLRRVGYEKK